MNALVAVAVSAGVALGAAPAGGRSFAPPPESRAWIGTWHTNQGDFRFNEIYNCQSGPQYPGGEPGKPGGACSLDGEWRHGGGAWQVILGTLALGPRYKGEVWEGCFRTPDYLPGHACNFDEGGDMLLFRDGRRFTGGYWKACGLGANCESHHPIRGTKVSSNGGHEPECPVPPGVKIGVPGTGAGCPDYTVNFLFHIDGFPDAPLVKDLPQDLASVDLQSAAASITWSPQSKKWTGQGDITMTDTYVDPEASPHIQDKQVTITIRGAGRFIDRGRERDVLFGADVVRSEDPECPVGAYSVIAFAVRRGEATLLMTQLASDQGCLSTKALSWLTHRFKRAKVFQPVPVD
jgi:hypothetical protein